VTVAVQPTPLVAVSDVEAASRWYCQVLGATGGPGDHGGHGYARLHADGALVLQLHDMEEDHHHGLLADPDQPLGNGVLLWFEVDAFDAAVQRIRALGAEVVTDVHVNPNSSQREIWIRDGDGYAVVLAEPPR
jgi:catechol 2,3-dioxygenase-like lactoylglutathione lyase family enzyme